MAKTLIYNPLLSEGGRAVLVVENDYGGFQQIRADTITGVSCSREQRWNLETQKIEQTGKTYWSISTSAQHVGIYTEETPELLHALERLGWYVS